MTPLENAVRLVLDELRDQRVALVGGLAVSARSEPRFTRDLDLAVAVANDTHAEQIIGALLARGFRVAAQVEQDDTKRLATVRTIPPGALVLCDLLFASSGIEPEVVSSASTLDLFQGCSAPVASVGHLIALKLLARSPQRPQDQVDLDALGRVATNTDLDEALAAVRLIAARGFARDKELERDFSEWRQILQR